LQKGEPLLPAGHRIGEAAILFAKINDRKDSSRLEIINKQKEKLEAVVKAEAARQAAQVPATAIAEAKAEIQYDDFSKLDLRTATILHAERVPKADKLLKLTVDLGYEQRTVVSGIALHYEPESIIGKKIVLVANLAPRKLMGIESKGMILMAEDAEGRLGFVSPPDGWVNGAPVK
jgi:methionyl-tRNA synthetase